MVFNARGEYMNKPILYMLIGIPGSGKSTFVKSLNLSNVFIANSDNYIDSIALQSGNTYDEVFDDNIKIAKSIMNIEVRKAIKNKMNIIWDQTNIRKSARMKKICAIPSNYYKIAIVFSIPEKDELCKRLNSKPGKTINQSLITNMINDFEMPSLDEGFDEIIIK